MTTALSTPPQAVRGRSEPVLGPFGAGRFRSRFTDAIWQGPTWSFAILLVVLGLVEGSDGLDPGLFVAGGAIVMATTLAGVLTPWHRLPAPAQAVLPLGDLAGAALMVLADPDGATGTLLLCALPVVWLAFEFARWGMAAGIVVTSVLGLATLVAGTTPQAAGGLTGVVVSTLFVVGLGVVARLMSGILRRVGETLLGQACEVEDARLLAQRRLDLMDGVLASIDVGVIVLHPDRGPQLNRSALAMTGLMGMAPGSLGAGGHHVYADDALTPVLAADQVVARAEAGQEFAGVMQWIGEPGDQRVVVASSRGILRPDGRRSASVLAIWDATELVDAVQVRERFLTTVSHELRTPLTAIAASAEVLVSELDGPSVDASRLVAAIARNTTLLRARIDELLTSAEAGDQPVRAVRTDVTALLVASLAKHDPLVSASGVDLVDRIEPGVVAELDPALFEQVTDNLVTNAVKYSPSGGSVTVSLRTGDEQVVLTVEDGGIGMSFDEQRQVFDRFYRAPQARASAIQGLGIGLSLVRSIVERHHGRIDLHSRPGEGTTVAVTVPTSVQR